MINLNKNKDHKIIKKSRLNESIIAKITVIAGICDIISCGALIVGTLVTDINNLSDESDNISIYEYEDNNNENKYVKEYSYDIVDTDGKQYTKKSPVYETTNYYIDDNGYYWTSKEDYENYIYEADNATFVNQYYSETIDTDGKQYTKKIPVYSVYTDLNENIKVH